jgi:hypothetical protein
VTPNASPTGSPTGTPAGELTLEQDIVFGPGTFIYTDTRAGLAELSSYKAALSLTFEGTRDGQVLSWSRTYTMLAATQPPARQLSIESTGDPSNPATVFMAEMEGAAYERRGEAGCTASAIQEGHSLADRLEPASFLTGVIGAEEAGSETVNNVTATHYTFDQRALGEEGLTESSGELWVAAEGRYIARYRLSTKGNADYFGEGIEGTLTLDYELTDINQPVTIVLPEACPPGMVDAPLLPDASDIMQVPGLLAYNTTTSLADATAYYQEQIPGLGWEPDGEPGVADTTAILNYRQGARRMTVVLTAEGDRTTVTISVGRSQE